MKEDIPLDCADLGILPFHKYKKGKDRGKRREKIFTESFEEIFKLK